MAGRYHLVREEDGELRPKKDKYSNLCDCLQYGCLALGEGRRMIGLTPARELKGVQTWKRTRHKPSLPSRRRHGSHRPQCLKVSPPLRRGTL
jgi:hypothetical protein